LLFIRCALLYVAGFSRSQTAMDLDDSQLRAKYNNLQLQKQQQKQKIAGPEVEIERSHPVYH
jgi:hypothetical protein